MTLADYEIRTLDFSAFRHVPGFGPLTQAPARVLWTVSDYVHVLADGMEYRCKVTGKGKRGEAGMPVVGALPGSRTASMATFPLRSAARRDRRAPRRGAEFARS